MKNVIPLIVAVVLGLAAVFAVSRSVSKSNANLDRKVDVVAAARLLETNENVSDAYIYAKSVSVSSLPKEHILWRNRNSVIGQKVLKSIAKDDYVLLSDVGMTTSMGNVIGDGEWGVPVSFSDATLVRLLQPGDEIAIVASYTVQQERKKSMDADAKTEITQKNVTAVLFPRVRVLDVVGGNGVILSLPPKQAMSLVAVQRIAELYPLLRKTNDSNALNRKDGGIFETSALSKMLEGLAPIDIPSVPADVKSL